MVSKSPTAAFALGIGRAQDEAHTTSTNSSLAKETLSTVFERIAGTDKNSGSRPGTKLQEIAEGVLVDYVAESPPLVSSDWDKYQHERSLQLKKLQEKNSEHRRKLEEPNTVEITETSPRPRSAILKKDPTSSFGINGYPKLPSFPVVSWKIPIADTKPTSDKKSNRSEGAGSGLRDEKGKVSNSKTSLTAVSKVAMDKRGFPEQKQKKGKAPVVKVGNRMVPLWKVVEKKVHSNSTKSSTPTPSVKDIRDLPVRKLPELKSPQENKKYEAPASGGPSDSLSLAVPPHNDRDNLSSKQSSANESYQIQVDNSIFANPRGEQSNVKNKSGSTVGSVSFVAPNSTEALESRGNNTSSNVVLEEVQQSSWKSLKRAIESESNPRHHNNNQAKQLEREDFNRNVMSRPAAITSASTSSQKQATTNIEAALQTKPTSSPTWPVTSAYFPRSNNNEANDLPLPCKKGKVEEPSILPNLSVEEDQKGKRKKSKMIHSPEQFPETSTAAAAKQFLTDLKKQGTNIAIKGLDDLLGRIKPPTLPEIEVCSVLPGTPEWQAYWMDFNQKMGSYYEQVERHSRRLDSLLVDEDGFSYKKDLKRRELEEMAMKLTMGLPPKPPLIRQPLKDTLDIGGYVIRPLGGLIPGAFITTYDHLQFRLELMVEKIESELENITMDPKFNMMTVTVPSKEKGNPFKQLIQITVPNYKKVQNLEVGHPLYNGGRIVITGK